MLTPRDELCAALSSVASLHHWLEQRGWRPMAVPLPLPAQGPLAHCTYLDAPGQPRAPRLQLLWRDEWTERALVGVRVRQLQREANHWRDTLRGQTGGPTPELFVLASPAFLLLFPLDGDPFARRLRFTPAKLEQPTGRLALQFGELRAELMATWARSTMDDDPLLAGIFGSAAPELTWDFATHLFVGEQLDEEFVAFLGQERRRLVQLLLEPTRRGELLLPILERLQIRTEDGFTGLELQADGWPTLTELVRLGRVRHRLIATVDTVLLRQVLYHYLEEQFGHALEEEERRAVAFGSWDELLAQTTRVDRRQLEDALAQATAAFQQRTASPGRQTAGRRKAATAQASLGLGDLPVAVTEPDLFAQGSGDLSHRYQASAGGDLHQGTIAAAADRLEEFLRQRAPDVLATLLEAMRADRYSFCYADLDPRAFQQFYEDTLGTDIRTRLDPATGQVEVGVMAWHRGRKEQGAYFTDRQLCRWMVERTVGRRCGEWRDRLQTLIGEVRPTGGADLAPLRAHLAELCGWRILDPTCGGGIFLKAAFEYLARQREVIGDWLAALPPTLHAELVRDWPGSLFAPDAPLGSWEWHLLLHVLYGVDIDIKALNVASNLLTLSALSYKRHGVSFPSFINTNLKRGNALVVPLARGARERFPANNRRELKQLVRLRARLRDPSLSRTEWQTVQAEEQRVSEPIRQAQLLTTFGPLYPGQSQEQVLERVGRVGSFLYELEFPEVFFDDQGRWRADAGFDIVLGNPPWEEPALELKHFLPEFDPEFRELSGPAARAREQELLARPAVAQRAEELARSIDDYKRLLEAGWYEHQQHAVRGKIPGAHTNLYKYATELAWWLLRDGGDCGLVLDGGLWNDLAANGLRRLLLDRTEVQAVCGFTNRLGLFPDVHRSYKFCTMVFRKGGTTDQLPAVFMRETLTDLDRFEELAVRLPVEPIRTDPRDCYPVPEVRSVGHSSGLAKLLEPPTLSSPAWRVDTYSRELNAGEQREYFHSAFQDGWYPLLQGAQFNLFGVHDSKLPEFWVDTGDQGAGGFLRDKQRKRVVKAIGDWLAQQGRLQGLSKGEAALAWIRAVAGKAEPPPEWIRLDWDAPRLAWRDITNATNERTIIATIVPAHVALTHMAPFVRPFRLELTPTGPGYALQYPPAQLCYLAGVLSSFPCDAVARSRLAKTHLEKHAFEALPVPPWTGTPAQLRVAALTACLTCRPATPERPWADYREFMAPLGLDPVRDALLDPQARREAEVELNARVAELYGLGRSAFAFLLDTLFMTPSYREHHGRLRDEILARLEPATP